MDHYQNFSKTTIVSEIFFRYFHKVFTWRDWEQISKYQYLSENFIRDFQNNVNWYTISNYQKLSDSFKKEFENNLKFNSSIRFNDFSKKNWLDLHINERMDIAKKYYDLIEINKISYIDCYKAVTNNYKSIYETCISPSTSHFIYDKLNFIYETNCDYDMQNLNSYGFGCWNLENAKLFAWGYRDSKIIKVRVPFDSICIVADNRGKIRSSKMEIIDLNPDIN